MLGILPGGYVQWFFYSKCPETRGQTLEEKKRSNECYKGAPPPRPPSPWRTHTHVWLGFLIAVGPLMMMTSPPFGGWGFNDFPPKRFCRWSQSIRSSSSAEGGSKSVLFIFMYPIIIIRCFTAITPTSPIPTIVVP